MASILAHAGETAQKWSYHDGVSWVVSLCAAVLAAAAVVVVYRGQRAAAARFTTVEAWYGEWRTEQWRAQATLVCAWPVSERETFEKVITRGVVGAAVRNASQMPVYQVEIVYRDPDAAWMAIRRLPRVPPDAAPQVFAGFDEEHTDGQPKPDRVNEDGSIRLAPSVDMLVELRFTDGNGRRWVRATTGDLSLVKERATT
jgi:hypothetical protein